MSHPEPDSRGAVECGAPQSSPTRGTVPYKRDCDQSWFFGAGLQAFDFWALDFQRLKSGQKDLASPVPPAYNSSNI